MQHYMAKLAHSYLYSGEAVGSLLTDRHRSNHGGGEVRNYEKGQRGDHTVQHPPEGTLHIGTTGKTT